MTARPILLQRVGAAAALVATIAVLVFWSITAPPIASVDEPRHVNSVLRLMQGGGWPPPQTASMLEGTLLAMREGGYPLGQDPVAPVPADERSVITDLNAEGLDGARPKDWMNQHPPTYYAIVAGAVTAIGAGEWRWDALVMSMRMVTVLFSVGTLLFAYGTLRRLGLPPAAVVLGMLTALGIPQFLNIMSLVSNDAMVVFAASGFLYFLVRAWRAVDADRPWAVEGLAALAGLFLGMALITKGTALTAIPAVGVTLLVLGFRRGGRWWRRLAPSAIAMAIAFAVGGWWYLRNIIVYGEIQSSNSGMGRAEEPAPGYDLMVFFRLTFTQLAETFWGSIRAALALPGWLVLTLVVIAALTLVIALVTSRDRVLLALLLLYPAGVGGLIVFHAWEVYWNDHRLAGVQGRYFFGAIVLFSALVGLAWAGVTRRAPAALRGVSAAAVAGLTLAVGAWGTWQAYSYRWVGPDGFRISWERAAEAGPFEPAVLIGVAIVAALAAASAVVIAVAAAAGSSSASSPVVPTRPSSASPPPEAATRHPVEGQYQ